MTDRPLSPTPSRGGRWRWLVLPTLVALLLPGVVAAQTIEELKRLTLEEMLTLEVTIVSRTPSPAALTPAAVYVIARDEIRRSTALSLPELLRLAPGMHVARMDSFRWSIGTRGLADRLSRSMLVLIDGRAVYNPLFAGTYWEVQDLELADIERIEIIRGPGGTLWGANAVNGIISIITRSARDTQGLLVRGIAGTEERGQGTIRYGTTAGESGHLRGYFKGFGRGPQFHRTGLDFDDWWKMQGGVRGDWTLAGDRTLTIQGDAYTARLGQRRAITDYAPPFSTTSEVDTPVNGGNLLARWSGAVGSGARFELQAYYDRTHRDEQPVGETRNTVDVDFQQQQAAWRGHQFTWGLGYRASHDTIEAVATSGFDPASYTDHLYSGFLQDEFPLAPALRVTLGTKVEHNSYSGAELQPSARMTWLLSPAHTIVGSVARAVRTPSRVETHYTTTSIVDPATPSFVRLVPNPAFVPEKLVAYEVGYRLRPHPDVFVTVSGFYNHLDDVLSVELLTAFVEDGAPLPNRLIMPVSLLNGLSGHSQGIETTADVRPAEGWRTTVNYSFYDVELARDGGGSDLTQEKAHEGRSPHHQVQLHTALDFPHRVSFDWFLRSISALPDANIPAYTTSDLRLGWEVTPLIELALVGRNLHDPHHPEWPSGGIEIQRSMFVSVTLRR